MAPRLGMAPGLQQQRMPHARLAGDDLPAPISTPTNRNAYRIVQEPISRIANASNSPLTTDVAIHQIMTLTSARHSPHSLIRASQTHGLFSDSHCGVNAGLGWKCVLGAKKAQPSGWASRRKTVRGRRRNAQGPKSRICCAACRPCDLDHKPTANPCPSDWMRRLLINWWRDLPVICQRWSVPHRQILSADGNPIGKPRRALGVSGARGNCVWYGDSKPHRCAADSEIGENSSFGEIRGRRVRLFRLETPAQRPRHRWSAPD